MLNHPKIEACRSSLQGSFSKNLSLISINTSRTKIRRTSSAVRRGSALAADAASFCGCCALISLSSATKRAMSKPSASSALLTPKSAFWRSGHHELLLPHGVYILPYKHAWSYQREASAADSWAGAGACICPVSTCSSVCTWKRTSKFRGVRIIPGPHMHTPICRAKFFIECLFWWNSL